MEAVG